LSLNLTRRDFLKLAGVTTLAVVGGGSIAIGPRLLRPVDGQKLALGEEVKVVKFTCVPNCTENCWLQAYVYDGRVRYIMPAPDYPEPEYTRGCLRGLS
jgi:nitrate reductase alpha subunit